MLVVTGIMALGLPFVLFGYREPAADLSARAAPAAASDPLVTWRELVVEPRFLLLAFILLLGGFFISAMVVHLVPMLIERGMSPGAAARIASLNGIALIVGRLSMGWLLDRLRAVWLGSAMFLIAGLGCLVFVGGGIAFAPIMVLAMGMMIGAEIDLLAYLVLRYFRFIDYGLIYGYLYGIYMIGCIASPWVTGYFRGIGGYDAMFAAATLTFGVIAALFPLLDLLRPASAGVVASTS
jgi:MFS family permease